MPEFRPFPALRYAPGIDLDQVLAPPYDVLSAADVAALGSRDPRNIVHVDVPDGTAESYLEAAATLRGWARSATLVNDPEPSFTIYRMSFVDSTGAPRQINGVLGELEVVDYASGGVLPHERITPKASTDRLDLTRATRANLSPVWGLSLAPGLTQALAEPGELVGAISVDGVEHRTERVSDPGRVARIAALVGSDDVLIADGHHRYGVARQFFVEEEAAGRGDGARHTLALISELAPEQLSIDAIHRIYRGVTARRLGELLSTHFDREPAPAPSPAVLAEMAASGRLVLLHPDGAAEWLIPRPGVFDDVRALDGAWLEQALADAPVQVAYQHGLEQVRLELAAGRADAAVLIRPTSLAEINRTAREGVLMPPKSTFFTPKPRTGFVIRPVDRPIAE